MSIDISLALLPDSGDPPPRPRFDLYVMDISYFSGKLECYFTFKELDHQRLEPTLRELEAMGREHTGSAQVPLVFDSLDQVWLRDTTPIMERLETDSALSSPANATVPSDPVMAYLAWLLEDYADESLWRLAMFYRWAPTLDARSMSARFLHEFASDLPQPGLNLLPRSVRALILRVRQVMYSVQGEDIRSEPAFRAMESEYTELLELLESILLRSPYLLGSRPSVADFGFMGPFFRHLSHDPTPRKIMQQRAPQVYSWCARMFSGKASQLPEGATFDHLPGPELRALLAAVAPRHTLYCRLNAEAFAAGHARFAHPDGSSRPVVPYRAWSFAQLQARFGQVEPAARVTLEGLLREWGAWQHLFSTKARAGDLDSLRACIAAVEPEGGVAPPLCAPGRGSLVHEKWPWWSVARWILAGR